MKHMQEIEKIKEICLNETSQINPNCAKLSWWQKHYPELTYLYDFVIELTPYMDSPKFGKRIQCLINGYYNLEKEPIDQVIRKLAITNGQLITGYTKSKFWEYRNASFVYNYILSNPIGTDIQQNVWHILNKTETVPKCPTCDKTLTWKGYSTAYLTYCSVKCQQNNHNNRQRTKQTKQERYGNANYNNKEQAKKTKQKIYGNSNYVNSEKIKQTKQERYGDAHYNNNEQIRSTMTERYGAPTTLQSDQLTEKVRSTMTERYGAPTTLQSDQLCERVKKTSQERYGDANYNNRQKAKQTSQERYGIDHYSKSHISIQSMSILSDSDKLYNLVLENGIVGSSDILGVDRTTIDNYLHKYNLHDEFKKLPSGPELKLKSWLDEHNIEYEYNNRSVLNGLELDFYFPEANLAIEVNGIYWHSTAPTNSRDKNYHYNKWLSCRELGITLLQYTDTQVYDHFDIITNKIKYMTNNHKFVIGARKCSIGPVHRHDEFKLLEENHIQGKLSARTSCLGAYYNNRLVAIINWSKRKKYTELTRYCCDTNASYPGLFKKMLKAMIEKGKITNGIVSFSNNDHSNGNVYAKSGFVQDKILGPAYWYTRDFKTLENRQNYMKSKIQKKFNIEISNKTEAQLMAELGYYRYYDSGKIKWIYNID